jgi:hypothetical protein
MAEFSSPIAGGLRIRRTRVSSFSFLNRPQDQQPREDFRTTLALQQNRLAFDNINSSLINLTNQVTALSASLDGIAQRVREDSALDQAREAQKVRQEQILAEQKLREGKESVVERKMQSALLRPVRKVGEKARFTLGRLSNFFMILLGGFLGNMALSTISALISGDKERLEELKQKFLKNIGVVGGIFLLFSGGLTTILGYLTRLGARLGSAVFRNLLIRPVNALINLVKEGVKGIARGLGLAPKTKPPVVTKPAPKPPAKAPPAAKPGGGKGKPGAPGSTAGAKPGGGFGRNVAKGGLLGGLTNVIYDAIFGSTVGELFASGGAGLLSGGGLAAAAYVLGAKFTVPLTIAGLFGVPFLSSAAKNLYAESGIGKDNPFLSTEINLGNLFTGEGPVIQTPELKPAKKDEDLSLRNPDDTGGNVNVINTETSSNVGNVQSNKNLGSANYLPSIPTAPEDNFYVTSSQLIYNTGWA